MFCASKGVGVRTCSSGGTVAEAQCAGGFAEQSKYIEFDDVDSCRLDVSTIW